MIHLHYRLLCFITLFSMLPGVYLHAQDNVRIGFRAVSWDSGKPESFCFFQNGAPVTVKNIQSGIRSAMFPYMGPPVFNLYPEGTLPPVVDQPPAQIPQPLAQVTLPENIKSPLLILVPNEAGKSPAYRVMVMEDDPSVFPFPSYLFVNFSRTQVAVGMGEEQFILQPGKSRLISSDQKTLNLQMAIPKAGRDGWAMVYDNFYPNWGEERNLLFIVDKERRGNPLVEPKALIENKRVWEAALETLKEKKPTDGN